MHAIEAEDAYEAVRGLLGTKPAVFFDRDGTLCRDAHYLNNWKDFELLPGIGDLATLRERGFMLIGITNQSGIARGLVEETFVQDINRVFVETYGFTDFLYCPHGPAEHCSCRKPEPGMAVSARARHGINLQKSFVVGDKDDDMLLARAIGARGVLVRTGKQQGSEYADMVVDNLQAAVQFIARWKE
jgi:heptosyltransferase-2